MRMNENDRKKLIRTNQIIRLWKLAIFIGTTFSIVELGDHFVVLKEHETRDAGDTEFVSDAAMQRRVDGANFKERKGARQGVDVGRHLHRESAIRGKHE